MTDVLLVFLNVSIPYIPSLAIKLFPMWKTRDVKTRSIVIYLCCFTLYICAGLLIVKRFWNLDFRTLQLFKLCASLPNMFMPFWVFRKRFWQNVFLYAMSCMYAPISVGVSIYASGNWFAALAYPLLAASVVSLITIVLTIPPLLFFLRRLCENPNMKQAGIWRSIWILPVLFFSIFLLAGSPFDIENFHGHGSLVIRALIYTAMLCTCYLMDTALRQVSENIILKENARLTENQLALQREQYEKLAQNAKAITTMRHDLRFHLAAVRKFANVGDTGKINEYIENLDSSLSAAQDKMYCKNPTVDAITAHHLGIAESEGVSVKTSLNIPENIGSILEKDLCIIMGNFLENAVEACRRIEQGNRFIRVHSQIADSTLSIVVSNSFDGIWHEQNGVYLSRKEAGETLPREGVGLSSVKAVCEKHHGLAQYEVSSDVWKSSALVHMEGLFIPI